MRWVALAIIFASLPMFIAAISSNPRYRDLAVLGLGLMMFLIGRLQIDAALITWPTWQGTARGIVVSPVDTLAIALIATRAKIAPMSSITIFIGLHLFSTALSILSSDVPLASTFSTYQYVRMILVFVALAGELHRQSALRHLLIGLSMGLMIQAGFVTYQKLTGVVQAGGAIGHQNITGLIVELTVLPLIGAVLAGEKNKFIYLGILAAMVVIAGGGSRGTIAFFALGMVFLLAFSLMRRITGRKMMVVGAMACAALVFAPLGYATLKDRFGESTFVTEETQRIAFERAARMMASDHPFGVGANMFTIENNSGAYADAADVAWNFANRSAPVHNAYLLARAETGWLGQGTFLLLLIMPPLIAFRFAFGDRKSPMGEVALGSIAAILAVAVHSNWEYAIFLEGPLRGLFMNFAIILGCIEARKIQMRMARQGSRGGVPTGEDTAAGQPKPALARGEGPMKAALRKSAASKRRNAIAPLSKPRDVSM